MEKLLVQWGNGESLRAFGRKPWRWTVVRATNAWLESIILRFNPTETLEVALWFAARVAELRAAGYLPEEEADSRNSAIAQMRELGMPEEAITIFAAHIDKAEGLIAEAERERDEALRALELACEQIDLYFMPPEVDSFGLPEWFLKQAREEGKG
jgi:hypothetical protein